MKGYPYDAKRAASVELRGPFTLGAGRAILYGTGATVATVHGSHIPEPYRRDDLAHAICAALDNPAPAFLALCESRQSCPANGEFWRRLAGSVRKALTMI